MEVWSWMKHMGEGALNEITFCQSIFCHSIHWKRPPHFEYSILRLTQRDLQITSKGPTSHIKGTYKRQRYLQMMKICRQYLNPFKQSNQSTIKFGKDWHCIVSLIMNILSSIFKLPQCSPVLFKSASQPAPLISRAQKQGVAFMPVVEKSFGGWQWGRWRGWGQHWPASLDRRRRRHLWGRLGMLLQRHVAISANRLPSFPDPAIDDQR